MTSAPEPILDSANERPASRRLRARSLLTFPRWSRRWARAGSLVGLGLALFCSSGCDRASSSSAPPKVVPPAAVAQVELVPLTNMVLIRAGTFLRQKHAVTLSRDFWLGKYEVTQREYLAVTGTNPSHFTGDLSCPVEKVRFTEAVAFCSAVTRREREAGRLPLTHEYRLPTEAEWEYACRAGTTNFYSFGDDIGQADQYAWTLENSESKTHPVGQKRPNPWGLYDMHGNVWEWCSDWFLPYPAADVRDPVGPAQGKFKVFRGGGWNNGIEMARAANRFMMAATNGIHFTGFRLALGPTRE